MATDWLPELSDDDLDTIVDALETWESKGASGEMFADMVGMMIGASSPKMEADVARAQAQEQVKRDRAKAVRKERSVLLRAKLLTLRDRRRVERGLSASMRETTG